VTVFLSAKEAVRMGLAEAPRRSKFGAVKCACRCSHAAADHGKAGCSAGDGCMGFVAACDRSERLQFRPHDSLRECRRWRELRLMELAGEIAELEEQVEYVLFEAQPGMRAVRMLIDFRYELPDSSVVLEDAKGMATKDWTTKRKWLKDKHGLDVRTV
jgi:hypothetical protein